MTELAAVSAAAGDDHISGHSIPDLDTMRDGAGQAADFLKNLANPDRLMILCHLSQQELTVSELERIFKTRQPTISQRLARLRDAGLVSARRDGKSIYYSLASDEAKQLIDLLYRQFCAR